MYWRVVIGLAGILVLAAGAAGAAERYFDLSHPVAAFAPQAEDPTKADLARPLAGSAPIPSFGGQAVFAVDPPFQNGVGHFYSGRLVISEHYGTHLDAPAHYVNDPETLESTAPVTKQAHELTSRDLIGPAVVIDISGRVAALLARNGGQPHPDKAVMDFSDGAPVNVGATDIDRVASHLGDGVWLVVNLGWSGFFRDADWSTSPYLNGWNFPGVGKAAIDHLIEIENAGGFRIQGIVIDNLGVDVGEVERGGPEWRGAFYSHIRGLQRGWKFVENASGLGQIAGAPPLGCTIVAGVMALRGGSGGPARVFALCRDT